MSSSLFTQNKLDHIQSLKFLNIEIEKALNQKSKSEVFDEILKNLQILTNHKNLPMFFKDLVSTMISHINLAYRKLLCKFILTFLVNSTLNLQNRILNFLGVTFNQNEVVILNYNFREEKQKNIYENRYLQISQKRPSQQNINPL